MMRTSKFFLALLITLILGSCSSEYEEPLEMYYEYFPIELDMESYFQMDSIHFNSFTGGSDTFSFIVKEVIDSIFLDLEGRETYRYYVYKQIDSVNWLPYKSGQMNLLGDRLERVIENERNIHLIFPVLEGRSWKGNALHSQANGGKWNYRYKEVHSAKNILAKTYSQSLEVFHYFEDNSFFRRSSSEMYALNVGLIYKEFTDINKQGYWDGPSYILKRLP